MPWNPNISRRVWLTAFVFALAFDGRAQTRAESRLSTAKPGEPVNSKAQKTFMEAADWQKKGYKAAAMDSFRKANAQDGGRCAQCLSRAYALAFEIGDYKTAETILRDWLPIVSTDAARATIHGRLGIAFEGEAKLTRFHFDNGGPNAGTERYHNSTQGDKTCNSSRLPLLSAIETGLQSRWVVNAG